jgi:hypothetical protein
MVGVEEVGIDVAVGGMRVAFRGIAIAVGGIDVAVGGGLVAVNEAIVAVGGATVAVDLAHPHPMSGRSSTNTKADCLEYENISFLPHLSTLNHADEPPIQYKRKISQAHSPPGESLLDHLNDILMIILLISDVPYLMLIPQ